MTVDDRFEALTRAHAAFIKTNLGILYPKGKPQENVKHGTMRTYQYWSVLRKLEQQFWQGTGLKGPVNLIKEV